MSPSPDQAVIHRTELPIDDRPHGIDLTGEILHTAVRRPGAVDVWYQPRPENMESMRRSFQVVGTGQPIPTHLGLHIVGGHKGTAISPDGQWVWHVLENWCPHQEYTEIVEMGQLPDTSALCVDCGVDLEGDGHGRWRPRP
ncbi:hypothetical protein DMH12_24910 [Streptomyces sp. WAC 04229]|uniref:DUF7352 domain-containing protein n=1 Tax=Streptomyces sp. WAC 04229 TaxID=2203206 RepID=UPI000F74844A|nr:hypothetical protein [Streptomyces sp. WAC 04229]RSN50526.1 hypothetical protein DMH12_24910 [Streptomyces sp. WAC 04229]